MNRLLLLVAFGFVCAPVANAVPVSPDQRYTIKLTGEAQVGQVLVVRKTTKNNATVKFSTGQGEAAMEQKTTQVKEVEYETEVLKIEDKQVVQFSRTYTKATSEDNGTKRTLSQQGRTVYFERKNGKVEVSVKDKPPLADADKAELEREANDVDVNSELDRALEPGKTVKIGETWVPDGKKIAKSFEKANQMAFDADKVKASCKLLKVYTLNKQQWGSLDVTFDLPIKSMQNVEVLPGTAMTMTGKVELPIDGSSGAHTSSFLIKGKIRVKVPGGGAELEADIEGTMDHVAEFKKHGRTPSGCAKRAFSTGWVYNHGCFVPRKERRSWPSTGNPSSAWCATTATL